ncbi:hypothetical protein BDR26DRAFT_807605 [Obelidium mucronatum]|nr:hypothetical protein BDR26DRAFT_807605 [Obelidium mucronatum]
MDDDDFGGFGGGGGHMTSEIMLLSCRCLSNLIEANPGASSVFISNGGVKILVDKLKEIEYIELAEQVLQVLEKVCIEYPHAIIKENGLVACVQYLDFFSLHVQRTAVSIVSKSCKGLGSEKTRELFTKLKEIIPILESLLTNADSKIVESAVTSLESIIQWSHSNHTFQFEASHVNGTPTSGNPTAGASSVGTGIFTQLIRMLVNICKGSTKLSVELLKPEYGVTDSVYSYLTGSGNVPSQLTNIGDVNSRMGIDSGVLSSMVMNSIVSRGSDQVIQVLVLACELFPALPKVGSEWCMKIDDPLVEEVHQTKDVNEKGKEAGKKKPKASSSAEFPQESFDTRRRNVMDSTPTTKAFLETYAFHLLPILIEVFSTSVHPRIRRLAVETVAKCVWFVNDVVQSNAEENVGRGSVVSIVDRDRAEAFVFVSAGVQLTSIVVHKCGAKIVGWLIREGILSEMRKSVEELECLVEKENRVESPSAVTSFVDPAGAGTGRAVRSASADRKGKSVAIGNESLASPPPANAASFLEGMKSALERMAGAKGKKENVPGITSSPSKNNEANDSKSALVSDDLMLEELQRIAQHFAGVLNKDDAQNVGVTGFEVLESGIIEGLTNYLTSPGLGESRPENSLVIYQTPLNSRLQAFLHIFLDGHKPISSVASSPTSRHIPGAFKQCVSRLQECLSRVEDFKLTVAVPSLSNSSQASPALQLARQIKLRLICEDPETVPPQFRNAVISIHAIATIKTFEDFLRGKVAGYSSSSGSSAAIGVAAGSEVVGLDETAKVGNSSESEDEEKNEDCDDHEDEEDREDEEHDENDEDADEEVNVLEELMEAEGELNEGRPSSAAVDLIPPPSPTKKKSPSRASSPTKSVASAASSALPKPAAPSSTYASAAASLQNSFSIKFFLEGTELLADETIFGALYRMEQSKSDDSSAANIWNKTFTLKYKKVPKEAEAPSTTPSKPAEGRNAKNIFEFNDSASLDGESKAVKILFLLRILFVLNTRWNEFYEEQNSNTVSSIITPLPPISFVNNKVTAKLNRQLNEPLIVASQVLPEWCNRVACDFSFLVPFESRVTYLQSTAFGYARCINRWKQSEGNSSTSNNSSSRINPSSLESAMMGGRVQRQKVRVSRNRLIDSMCKVMDLYGQGSHSIEVEFFDEVGTGLGPTLEFYSSVCKEMRKREGVPIAGSGGVGKSVVLWRENGGSGDYLNPSEGLFPAPISQSDYESDEGRSRLSLLQSLGSFVAKALLDSRIVDMPFSTLFLDMAVGSRHIGDVYKFAQLKASIDSKETLSESDKKVLLAGLTVKDARLEDLCLDFTLPGYPSVEIKPNGANIPITLENVSEYIDRVVDMTVGSGIRKQVDAFRTGFDRVFPISKLKCFSLEELCLLMGGTLDEDWSYLTIVDAIKADHGYSIDSKPVQNLVEMMEKFTLVERREFLMFVTGSPKLPIGGFKALNPQLTVVRKNADFGQNADSYLPSVMTCVNYLKVPAYTSLDVMRERFEVAMKEGQGSFHLS